MRFLLVEDTPYHRKFAIKTLHPEFPGATFEEISGEKGFQEALARGHFDVVLTDYKLKWGDGFIVLARVKDRFPDKPVLMVTDQGCEEVAVQALKAGMSDYVLKKHLSRLPDAVREATGRAQFRESPGVTHAVAEHKKGEGVLARQQRLYAMLSGVNQAIVRTEDRETLFNEACHHLVDVGGLRMAWIGLVDPDTLRVKPVAQCGFDEGYLESIVISAADVPEGHGPTGTAIRKGKYVVCNDWEEDTRMAPWREEALKRGYRSSAAFPLHLKNRVVGALNVYSEEAGFFHADECALLDSLASDLSFALLSLEQEAHRKCTEEALRQSESRYRRIVETSREGIWVIDDKANTAFVNARMAELLGYAPEEMIGVHFFNFMDNEAREKAAEYLERRRQGIAEQYEFTFRRKDGSPLPTLVSTNPFLDPQRKFMGALAMITDISDLRRAEEEVRSLARFPAEDPSPVLRVTRSGTLLYANKAAHPPLRQWDCRVGQKIPDDLQAAVNETFAAGTCKTLEIAVGDRHFSLLIAPIPAAGYANLYGLNVTERKRAEEALRKAHDKLERQVQERTAELARTVETLRDSETRYHTLFYQSPHAILVIDPQTARTVEFNDTAHRQLGYTREEFARLGIFDYEAKESEGETRAHMKRILREGQDDFETRHRTKQGEIRDVHVMVKTIEVSGKPVFMCIFRDLSGRSRDSRAAATPAPPPPTPRGNGGEKHVRKRG